MKIRFIYLIILFLVGVRFGAQAQDERKTYLGVKGGYNTSMVNVYHSFNGYEIDQGLKHGYQAGIVVMNFLRNHIGIQAELNYTQKGYIQRFSENKPELGSTLNSSQLRFVAYPEGAVTQEPDFESTFDYIELPFLFNLHTGKNQFHVFFNAGCYFEYLLKVESSPLPTDTEGVDFHPYDESRDPSYGYGFRGGIGSFYESRLGTFMLEASFSYDLSNYIDPVTYSSGEPTLSNHMMLGVTLGYLVSFGAL
ncbi:Outer membrane protein beta-barrel domain-containing protein [Reichenbachiella agariperforans]|uniref:Outer membrane protein beta-barrel domain-containing protein n=1 Tax=Reichenbachiella agariperforans TaxID=156994 RepID=A0A1M6UV37_REIAG|nr:porin family protein [Reichenbachiella agariperforans]SHK73100.1 Outer membrane protein beta-barrel domain-containing protein [Reichenbachiella agariperforans]